MNHLLVALLGVFSLGSLLMALPAIAAGDYPLISLGGYLETIYEVESFRDNAKVPGGETLFAFQRLPFHVGQVKLLASYELNENIDGLIEVFPWPKGSPVEYANEYKDYVGNNASVPDTMSGRLQVTLRDLAGAGSSLTLGQIRVPFGIWDDFSCHRKMFTAKNDVVIFNGSPLRRIDMGASFDGRLGDWLTYRLASVARSLSSKVNDFALSDYVLRIGAISGWGSIGLNTYVVDPADAPLLQKGAIGIDYNLYLPFNLSMIGEYIAQNDFTKGLYSQGIFTRLNYDLSDYLPGLRPFIGYERTSSNTDSSLPLDQDGVIGIRYRTWRGVTLGADFQAGDKYPGGNLVMRMETQF